jgi:hypothetical protein
MGWRRGWQIYLDFEKDWHWGKPKVKSKELRTDSAKGWMMGWTRGYQICLDFEMDWHWGQPKEKSKDLRMDGRKVWK